MSNLKKTQVVTGEVRLSYVHLFEPYAPEGQEPRYSVTILIPKTDTATYQRIQEAIAAAIEEGVQKKWGGVRPPQIKTPLHDGDGPRPNGEPFGPECRGHWVLTASSRQQQQVVDAALNPIIDQTKVYSGVYGRVHITFFAFNRNGNRGIGAGLGPVQILRDGEPLGGRVLAEQVFTPVDVQSTTPTAPAAQPQAFGVPPMASQPVPGVPTASVQQQTYGVPPQPAYGTPAIDPITGKPLSGGVLGLN